MHSRSIHIFIVFLFNISYTYHYSYPPVSIPEPFLKSHNINSSYSVPNIPLLINSTSNVLIIGGTKHIGLELTKIFASRGATVYASHRSPSVPSTLSKLRFYYQSDPIVHSISIDLIDEYSIRRAASSLSTRLNGKHLTHIIHVAGFRRSPPGHSETAVNREMMKDILSVNAIGPLLISQHFQPLLLKNHNFIRPVFAVLSNYGSTQEKIVVSNSKHNSIGSSYAHVCSQGALYGIMNKLRLDWNNRVVVTLIHPERLELNNGHTNMNDNIAKIVSEVVNALDLIQSSDDFYCVDRYGYLFPW